MPLPRNTTESWPLPGFLSFYISTWRLTICHFALYGSPRHFLSPTARIPTKAQLARSWYSGLSVIVDSRTPGKSSLPLASRPLLSPSSLCRVLVVSRQNPPEIWSCRSRFGPGTRVSHLPCLPCAASRWILGRRLGCGIGPVISCEVFTKYWTAPYYDLARCNPAIPVERSATSFHRPWSTDCSL